MENSFLPKAIDTVKDAIAADTREDYEIALGLYKKSLEYFMTGLKYETNPVSGINTRSSIVLYVAFETIWYIPKTRWRNSAASGYRRTDYLGSEKIPNLVQNCFSCSSLQRCTCSRCRYRGSNGVTGVKRGKHVQSASVGDTSSFFVHSAVQQQLCLC